MSPAASEPVDQRRGRRALRPCVGRASRRTGGPVGSVREIGSKAAPRPSPRRQAPPPPLGARRDPRAGRPAASMTVSRAPPPGSGPGHEVELACVVGGMARARQVRQIDRVRGDPGGRARRDERRRDPVPGRREPVRRPEIAPRGSCQLWRRCAPRAPAQPPPTPEPGMSPPSPSTVPFARRSKGRHPSGPGSVWDMVPSRLSSR